MKLLLILSLLLSLSGCTKEVKAGALNSSFGTIFAKEKTEAIHQQILENRRVSALEKIKEENEDFIGIIRIGNLIEEYVVQCEDNKQYLKEAFDGSYSGKGTVFMDYRNKFDDQNMILYGHYVYYDESSMFSPLHQLKKEENYDENKYIEFEMFDRVRTYQIVSVFYYDLYKAKPQYFHTEYADYLAVYLEDVQEAEYYDTGVEITPESKLLSLQTCVRNRDDLRLIVLAVEIEM